MNDGINTVFGIAISIRINRLVGPIFGLGNGGCFPRSRHYDANRSAFGLLVSFVQIICSYKIGTFYSGLLIFIPSLAVISLFLSHDRLTYQELVYFAVFVSIPSFLISFLVDRFILHYKR